ncbi:MAG: HAD-IIA family hydrolase [bacterium]|nr:HAD-IIA family hydrolase [bacterium]
MSSVLNVVIDLDGVMWVGSDAIEGAAEAANRLAVAGCNVVFVTNMSRLTVREQQERLARCGVRPPMEVVTSAVAAASLLVPTERVLVCGGEGIVEAVKEAGGAVVRNSAGGIAAAEPVVDAVVVGMDPTFDYAACGRAMRAVRAGARLIGTNHDPTYPTPAGLEAGGGAILAAVAAAAEAEPIMAGKPHGAIVSCVRARLGPGAGVVIGDRPDSDGLLAEALGFEFALVLTGVTTSEDLPVQPPPALVAEDLAAAVNALL